MRSKKATAALDIDPEVALKEIKREKKRRHLDDNTITVGKFFDPQDDELRLEDFEDALQIDEDDLDTAVKEQPDLVYRVGRKLALQISRRDAAKTYVANQEAMVDAQLRRAHKQSTERVTVGEIEAQKCINAKVVSATDQLLRMEHSVREWQAMKDAVVSRGHALRDLVQLYINESYQTSSIGGGATIKMREVDADRARRAMNAKRRSGQ